MIHVTAFPQVVLFHAEQGTRFFNRAELYKKIEAAVCAPALLL